MKDYISFKILNYSGKFNTKIFFNNNLGKNPFIYQNELYIPKDILRDEYQPNFGMEQKVDDKKSPNNKNNQIDNSLYLQKPTGLINYGASVCYMNALLQCFYYCYPMTQYFLNLDDYQINRLGLVSKSYYNFVKYLNSGNEYAAKEFKDALIYTDSSFAGTEGKDSKDLAFFILTELHEELKENENSLMVLNQNTNHYNKYEVYKEKIDLMNINRNNTIISDTFDYLIISEHKCNNIRCQGIYSKNFYNIQNQNIIVFELETIYKSIHKSYKKQISLNDCLNIYFKNDILNCPFCKTNKLEKKKVICSLPNILIFVMNRGKYAKFDCKINFTKEIDLKDYYIPMEENLYGNKTKYNLICATLVYDWNKGYSHGGHTIAFCKTFKNNQYYIFNDSTAKPYDINKIYNETPYLLFYEKIK